MSFFTVSNWTHLKEQNKLTIIKIDLPAAGYDDVIKNVVAKQGMCSSEFATYHIELSENVIGEQVSALHAGHMFLQL